nr:MAG TPA: hypothetical protein [Caudoviricetes sp.]
MSFPAVTFRASPCQFAILYFVSTRVVLCRFVLSCALHKSS